MKCPYCDSKDTDVLETRDSEDLTVTRRRRSCPKCEKRFTSYEKVTDVQRVSINSFSYNNNLYANVFYLFILEKRNEKDIIILPAHIVGALSKDNKKTLGVNFLHKGKNVFINEIKPINKINKYLNESGWRNLSFS